MALITLCLIVKNEERYLENCLKSVKQYVDDIVIIDTGSTDNTKLIAKKYTENLHEFSFNGDFSEARNYALNLVKSPWVLFLDADEEFEEEEIKKVRALIQNASPNTGAFRFIRYNFFATGGWYSNKVIKLFRNEHYIRYTKQVNESVEQTLNKQDMEILNTDIILNHFGHCRLVGERDEKSKKYIEYMKSELNKNPNDAILYGYIGIISRTLGDFNNALEYTSKALNMNRESATLNIFHAHVLRSTNKINEALQYYNRARKIRPNDASAINMEGVMQLTLGNFDEADTLFKKAFEISPELIHVLINRGLVKQFQGRYEEALEFYNKVTLKNKAFLRQDRLGLLEVDPYRAFYYETITEYPGLENCISFCSKKLVGGRLLSIK